MSIKSNVRIPVRYNDTAIGEAMQRVLNREIDNQAHRYKTGLQKAMKVIGQQAISDWYHLNGLHTGSEVASALRVESGFIRSTNKQKIIRLTSYFDTATLDAMSDYYESAVKWSQKHAELCTDMSVGVYIFTLRWDFGTLALPEKAHFTGSGWVNENFEFSSLGTLKDYYFNRVKSGLEVMGQSFVRGANTYRSAETKAAQLTGVNNLVHGK